MALAVFALLALPVTASSPTTRAISPQSPTGAQPAPLPPVTFEENLGQVDRSVRFIGRVGNEKIYFSPDGVIFLGPKELPNAPRARRAENDTTPYSREVPEEPAQFSATRMRFVGASLEVGIAGVDRTASKTNYLKGSDPTRWQHDIPNFGRVTYAGLYPGVDLTFYQRPGGGLEYDFVVAPGADPSQIRLAFDGADDVATDASGNLVVSMAGATHTQTRPVLYQQDGRGSRRQVDGQFRVGPESSVSFDVGRYDTSALLIIDPTIVYSSYLGGSLQATAYGVAVDMTSNAYVVGTTYDTDFPITAGAFQTTLTGTTDAFVTKLNPQGSALVYSTYLGGGGFDEARGIAVDSEGRAWIVGRTTSLDFPTLNAQQLELTGNASGFVSQLGVAGSTFAYSTYYGTAANAVAVDSSGSAYVTGSARWSTWVSSSAIAAVCDPPYPTSCVVVAEATITKLNPAGGIIYSSYLGGAPSDGGSAIAVDGAGNAVVAGSTQSTATRTVVGFQPTCGKCSGCPECPSADAFITKVNPSGTALVYSSYLGGWGQDYGDGVAIDSSGAAFVSGSTQDIFVTNTFPILNAFQPIRGGAADAFVTKVNPQGSALVYSSFLGGTNQEQSSYVAVDMTGNAYVSGDTSSTNFPIARAFQSTHVGSGADAFLTKVNPYGNGVVYSSYLGGSGGDGPYGIAVDAKGDAYIVGGTASVDFPTVNSYQTCAAVCPSAFITKIHDPGPPPVIAGTTTNSTWAAVSVYNAVTGTVAAYQCCNVTDTWSVPITPSSCSSGGGYKVLMLPIEGYQVRWYNDKPNFSQADCVDSPSANNNSTLPPTGVLTGYVKDAATATDINGAMIYFYNSSGVFVGWTKSGRDGPGRFRQNLSSSDTYKVLVVGPPGYEDIWSDGAMGFGEATPTSSPASVNFSLRAAGTISGQSFQVGGSLLPGVLVSAYPSCGCTSPKNARSDAGANYSIKVPTTASSGYLYRVRFIPPTGQTRWYSSSTSFGSADDVSAPNTNLNVETPP